MGDSMSTIINATTTNGVVIQPDNSGSLVLQTNSGTTALTIDTSQRAAFVAGTAALPAITTTGDTDTGIWFPAADTIAFAEGGAESMRIDSSGRVGIAKSSGLTGQLNVTNGQGFSNGTGALTLASVALDGSYGGGLSFIDGTQGYSLWSETSGADFYIRRATTTSAFTGGVFINNAATSWSAASDENVKDIIEPIENAIEKVLTLRTVIGKYKDEEEGIRHPFLIAQDVEKVLPEAISLMNKGKDNECLGLSYTDTIPLLVAAIKEQQTIINDLKARVETLEAK
jgi:Chaperone of endosialidase